MMQQGAAKAAKKTEQTTADARDAPKKAVLAQMPGRSPRDHRPSKRGQGMKYSIEQAVSDRAQLHTIAFDGLAFLTGDFGCDTFLPPGKVSDYFGFQYMRDIDAKEGGHNTSFLTRIAHNMLAILNDDQKAQLVALAKEQENDIRRFAEKRLPLIKAFRRNLEGDLPAGSKGLDKDAVVKYSADLYELDGLLAFQRAKVMGGIIRSLNDAAESRLGQAEVRRFPDLAGPAGAARQAEHVPRGQRGRDDLRQRDVRLVRRLPGGRHLLLPRAARDVLRRLRHEDRPGHGQAELLDQHFAHGRQRRGLSGRADRGPAETHHGPGGPSAPGPGRDRQDPPGDRDRTAAFPERRIRRQGQGARPCRNATANWTARCRTSTPRPSRRSARR